MTTLPTGSQLTSAPNTAAMKGLMSDQASAIAEMPGGRVASTLVIAAGVITPDRACHLVDTEGSSSADDLTTISVDNHPDGRRLLLSMVDSDRVVTIKHNAGGAGQVALVNGYDLVLRVGGWVELKRTGSNWEEVSRSQNLIGTVQLSGAVNESYATVASHATTADIWGARGNVISFTGTATVTAFPAAPQAGVRRRLICAGACSFTAGASMVIDGVTSGSTLTVAAGDVLDVEAVGTTSFKLHHLPIAGYQVRGADVLLGAGKAVVFEGATDDGFETTVTVADPTADRTVTLPNATGTIALLESGQGWTKPQRPKANDARTTGGTVTLDFTAYQNFTITLSSALTLGAPTIDADCVGQKGTIRIIPGSYTTPGGWWAGLKRVSGDGTTTMASLTSLPASGVVRMDYEVISTNRIAVAYSVEEA